MSTRTVFLHLQVPASAVQALEADLFDRLDKFKAAAVHDRHFRTVDFHDQVVDTHAEQSRHQMLDGRDTFRGRIAKNGAKRRSGHLVPESRNFD